MHFISKTITQLFLQSFYNKTTNSTIVWVLRSEYELKIYFNRFKKKIIYSTLFRPFFSLNRNKCLEKRNEEKLQSLERVDTKPIVYHF